MNKTQMQFGMGALLAAFMIIGILFIIVGISPHNDLLPRVMFSATGILLFIVSAVGFNSLRKLQYG